MALDKLVDSSQLDSDLTSVANAIRTKGGTSAQLAFPQGFADAIAAIPTGGGDYAAGDWAYLSKPSGDVISAAPLSSAAAGDYAFYKRSGIRKVFLSEGKYVGSNMFYQSGVTFFVGPNIITLGPSSFNRCYYLEAMDISGSGGTMGASSFYGCSIMSTIVIRSHAVMAMANVNALNNSNPFANGKSGGTLYVPADMISSYQSATNWSTILGFPNNQILPIEGSIYETQYVDGTPIPAA